MEVGNTGVSSLLTSCWKLKELDLTGMKALKNECLSEAIENEAQHKRTALRSLTHLSFHRVDYVMNDLLEKVFKEFQHIEIRDFYNEIIEL